jgi:hypothetical protein
LSTGAKASRAAASMAFGSKVRSFMIVSSSAGGVWRTYYPILYALQEENHVNTPAAPFYY